MKNINGIFAYLLRKLDLVIAFLMVLAYIFKRRGWLDYIFDSIFKRRRKS